LLGPAAFNPFLAKDMGVGYVIWQALTGLAVVLTWQTVIARVLASKDPASARKIYTRTSYYFVGRFALPGLWGLGALAVLGNAFKSEANPELSLMAMPTYLGQILPAGFVGLVVAGMLAAEMSTDSSYLLAWASVIYNDIICPLKRKPFSERAGLWVNGLLVAGIGIFLLFYGLWYKIPGRAWDYLQITGEIYFASMSVLLVCALYWKWTHSWGGYAALLSGAIGPIIFLILSQTEQFKNTPAWIPGVGSFLLAALGMVVGSLFGQRRDLIKYGVFALVWSVNFVLFCVLLHRLFMWYGFVVSFWSLVIISSVLWYGFLVFYVGYRGFFDIIDMTRALKRRHATNQEEKEE
jgi:SSS family solute:Na+ symporter